MYFLGMCASGTAATVLYLQAAREQDIRHCERRSDGKRRMVVLLYNLLKAREEALRSAGQLHAGLARVAKGIANNRATAAGMQLPSCKSLL